MIGSTNQSQQQQQQQQHPRQSLKEPSQHQHQHLVNHRLGNSSHSSKQDEDDDYQDDNGMRVGNNYQAEIPQFVAYAPAPEYYEDEKAIRVWSPYNKIPDHVLEEFITKAKEKYFYNTEQALGMLSWHKFDLNRAYADLPNFVPYPNEWSVEDKVLFEQAYQFHEKQFNKIKQMLPDKSMANLINYYYSWKKTRTRASLMERQTRRFAARRAADSNNPSDDDEDVDEDNEMEAEENKEEAGTQPQSAEDSGRDGPRTMYVEDPDTNISCVICSKRIRTNGDATGIVVDGYIDNFCLKCFVEWKRGGQKVASNVELGDCFYHPAGEPKRILFSYSDVKTLVEGVPEDGDLMLKQLDAQVQDVKREIQTKKQKLSQITEKIQPIAEQIAELNITEFSNILPDYKPTDTWTQEETQLAIQGFRRYGLDYSAISDVLRTKSPEAVRMFYTKQSERLGLEALVNEFNRCKKWGGENLGEEQKSQN